MNPASYNFYLSAFKETNHPQLWGLVFPGDKDITLGFVTQQTSVLPLPISYLPQTFSLFYCIPGSRDGSFHPLYLGSPQDLRAWCRDNQLFPQDLYNWVYFEVWFHDRRAAVAIQETKAGVKQEQNEQPRPHFRKHIWAHMKWAGTMVLKSFPPAHRMGHHTALFPHIPAAPTSGRPFPWDRRVYGLWFIQ